MPPVLVGRPPPTPPDPKKPKAVAYRGPTALVARIDRHAKDSNLSRNEAMTQLLEYALAAHEGRRPKR